MKLAKSLNRLGTETAFSVLARAKKLEAQGKPMIHLGLGQPDFKTPKHIVEAAKKEDVRWHCRPQKGRFCARDSRPGHAGSHVGSGQAQIGIGRFR